MEYVIIIEGIVTVGAIIFGVVNYFYWKRNSKRNIEEYRSRKYFEEKEKFLTKIREETSEATSKLTELNNEISQKTQFNNSMLQMREDELNRLMETKREAAESTISHEIAEWEQSAQEAATFAADQIRSLLTKEIDNEQVILEQIKKEVEDYRLRREAINQEIMRSRAIEEQQDFYRVQISEEYQRDIDVLNGIRSKISKIDILDKLIYDNYVKKSVDEMVKRVLNGAAPCGIYKITRLKTGEVYIGKSTDIKARWQQHCKSCYHCGTISHSNLHTTMEHDGLWNWTFELLEEVPKDKLTEREKYWIEFYDSKKYGLNERIG